MRKKFFGGLFVSLLLLAFVFSVHMVFATTTPPAASDQLINPLPIDNLTGMFLYIVKGFLSIIGVWGVLFVIVGGFRMVTAAGNEEQYIAAKKTITWAILGVVVAVMSFSIMAIVQNLIGVDAQKIQSTQPQPK
ncbi:MAG: pilin [Patescibacteria group bacterium]|nr:pilin [Patescibacteria group bacterium]